MPTNNPAIKRKPTKPSTSFFNARRRNSSFVVDGSIRSMLYLTREAQQPDPRAAWTATAARWPGSLEGFVMRRCVHACLSQCDGLRAMSLLQPATQQLQSQTE